jgi:AcrR family transcriptional regulator
MAQNDAKQLLPIIAKAFAMYGYRRATTAMLARACGVRENVIYRVWPSKKAMFLASIDYVWESSSDVWQTLLEETKSSSPTQAIQRMLQYESTHHGEMGLYRIVFTGLSEIDDPEIAAAMRRMYQHFHGFIVSQVAGARQPVDTKVSAQVARKRAGGDDELVGWAFIGLATVANIGSALGVPGKRQRSLLYTSIGKLLIDAAESPGRSSSR